jgi:hypothetical protein
VSVAGRRYIVCRNHAEAAKDAADRTSILAALERQLAKGDKALVGNTGYRRYLKTIRDDHFAIDPDRVEEDKKFDGIFVLRTNTDLKPLDAMLQAIMDCGADVSHREASAVDTTYLSQTRRDNPRPRVLQFFGSDVEESPGRPPCRAGARRLVARDHRRSRFSDRD